MNKTEMKNIVNITKFNLKTNFKAILGWSISMFLIMFLYMILFPSMKNMAAMKIEAMPSEMLKFFGVNSLSDMNNYMHYFGIMFNMIIIAASLFAASFSAKLVCGEEKSKSIEFLNSLNVNRSEIYFSKLITVFISLTIVLLSSVIAGLICGFAVGGETFVLIDYISVVKISGISIYIFMAISFLLSGISSKMNVSMISSLIIFVSYIIGYIGVLIDKSWLLYFSPIEMFNMNNALAMSSTTIIALLIYFSIMILSVILGNYFYKRRDFSI